jgi:hypothetical protein
MRLLKHQLNNKIRVIILLVLVFVLLSIPASAGLSIIDQIGQGFSNGFDQILISITDQLYEFTSVNNTNISQTMMNLYVQPNDFMNNPAIQEQKDFTSGWYAIIYIFFVIGGYIKLLHAEATYDGYGEGPEWRNTYFKAVLILPLIWAFYLVGLQSIFDFEYIIRSSASMQIMDIMPPTANNAIGYFFLGLQIIINILFMYYRYIIVGIITSIALLFVILYYIPYTKQFAIHCINYGVLLLFAPTAIVLIYLLGYGIIKGSFLGQIGFPAPYAIVLLIAVLFILGCMLYLFKFFLATPAKIIFLRKI